MDLKELRTYRLRLRELQASRARVAAAYEDEIRAVLGEARPSGKIEEIRDRVRFEDGMISDEIDVLVTDGGGSD